MMNSNKLAPVLGANALCATTLLGASAHANTTSPAYAVYDGSRYVGYGSANTTQWYQYGSGSQVASFYTYFNPAYASVSSYRGLYGASTGFHTALMEYQVGEMYGWNRVQVAKVAPQTASSKSTDAWLFTGVSWSVDPRYGTSDLHVQVRTCLNVVAWFDSCDPWWTTYRY